MRSAPRGLQCRYIFSFSSSKIEEITPEQLKTGSKKYDVVVDVRNLEEVQAGNIPGHVHIPLDVILSEGVKNSKVAHLKGKRVLMYCRGGVRSLRACEALPKDFANVASLKGGFSAYSQ